MTSGKRRPRRQSRLVGGMTHFHRRTRSAISCRSAGKAPCLCPVLALNRKSTAACACNGLPARLLLPPRRRHSCRQAGWSDQPALRPCSTTSCAMHQQGGPACLGRCRWHVPMHAGEASAPNLLILVRQARHEGLQKVCDARGSVMRTSTTEGGHPVVKVATLQHTAMHMPSAPQPLHYRSVCT